MRTFYLLFITMICLAWMAPTAKATVYTWTPGDHDLADLPHEVYSVWGIGLNDTQAKSLYQELLSGESAITGATLTFSNIYDWTQESNDHLYTHLLTDARAGVRQSGDTTGGDQFAGVGTLIGNWSDPQGGNARNFNLIYDFSQLDLLDTLQEYVLTDNTKSFFGLTFDADCHYYNCGITFQIITENLPQEPVVPEPATIALLGIGLTGMGFIRRRRDRAMAC